MLVKNISLEEAAFYDIIKQVFHLDFKKIYIYTQTRRNHHWCLKRCRGQTGSLSLKSLAMMALHSQAWVNTPFCREEWSSAHGRRAAWSSFCSVHSLCANEKCWKFSLGYVPAIAGQDRMSQCTEPLHQNTALELSLLGFKQQSPGQEDSPSSQFCRKMTQNDPER